MHVPTINVNAFATNAKGKLTGPDYNIKIANLQNNFGLKQFRNICERSELRLQFLSE